MNQIRRPLVAAHLAFLEDYVGRVSDGKTTLTTHLVPEVVRLSQPMGAYSPTGLDYASDAEMRKLAALVEAAMRPSPTFNRILEDAQP